MPLFLEPLETRTLLSIICVDGRNTTGVTNGSTTRPFTTVQAAVTASAGDDVIKVAQGTYAENVVIPDKSVQILGGFAGGTATNYANGQPGDFATATPSVNVTRIVGASATPVLALQYFAAKTVVIDGFTISGGLHGIYCQGDEGGSGLFPTVTIAHNVIENNGPAQLQPGGGAYSFLGGGIYSEKSTITITQNTLRNNNANRGGGLFITSLSDYTITDNLIENNSGYDDHCGGVALLPLPQAAAGSGTFSRNVIRGNVAAKAFNYGWGGGMLVFGNENPSSLKPLTLSHNVWTGNVAPSVGGALFVDDGATVVLDHELMFGNSTGAFDGGGGAIFLDGTNTGVGSSLTIVSSTIAGNSSVMQAGNGVYVVEFSSLTVTNSIFWGNTDDFLKDNTSTITVTYTDSQEPMPGTGNLSTDPLFANAAAGDFHLKSTAGRFDPTAQGGAGGFVLDAVNSPAIDAGNPASAFALETAPNGGRINLGFEGNTAEASRSASAVSTGPGVFVLGLDGQVYVAPVGGPGAPPGGYALLAPGRVQGFSVGRNGSGLLELFVQGLDGQVWALRLGADGRASGGYFLTTKGQVKALSAAQTAAGAPEVFVIGLDDQVYAQVMNAAGTAGSGYFRPAGGKVKALSAAQDSAGGPVVFVIGQDGRVYAQDLDAAGRVSGGYFRVADGQVMALSAGQDGAGNPLLLVVGKDGQVWGHQLDGTGHGVGGYYLTRPGSAKSLEAGQDGAGLPAAYVIGLDSQVYVQRLTAAGRTAGGYTLVASGPVRPALTGSSGGEPSAAELDAFFSASPLAASGNYLGFGLR